jgi:hypothetical protein
MEPPDPAALTALQLGFALPPECAPGVAANLKALAEHWRNLEPDDYAS